MTAHHLTHRPSDPKGYGDGMDDTYECACGETFGAGDVQEAFEHGLGADTAPLAPALVVAFVEGGLVQTSVELPGEGVPIFEVLDFDRDDSSDLDEARDFHAHVYRVAAAMAERGYPMDPAWITDADTFLERAQEATDGAVLIAGVLYDRETGDEA